MTFKQNLTEKSTKKTKIRLELHWNLKQVYTQGIGQIPYHIKHMSWIELFKFLRLMSIRHFHLNFSHIWVNSQKLQLSTLYEGFKEVCSSFIPVISNSEEYN